MADIAWLPSRNSFVLQCFVTDIWLLTSYTRFILFYIKFTSNAYFYCNMASLLNIETISRWSEISYSIAGPPY